MSDDDPLLAEQKAYYAARAPEYDEWWTRAGRYDRGGELNARWFAEIDEVCAALDAFGPRGRVLDIACGTGWWTRRLASANDVHEVVAVDASSEVLAINRVRTRGLRVRHVQTDLFAWSPDARYDNIFFGFWLSHVPPERVSWFLGLLSRALVPGGGFFFVDNQPAPTGTATDQSLDEGPRQRRRLNDGREFDIVKVYYEPSRLTQTLRDAGFDASIWLTPNYFIYGCGRLT